jgi:uncharacterized membrane protein (UPF0127 family)
MRLPQHEVVPLVFLTLALPSCERRVDEPLPEVRPLGASAVSVVYARDAVSAKGPEPANPWGDRCVRPSPKVAQRVARKGPDPRCPKDPGNAPKLQTGTVTFITHDTVTVEIAQREADRQRGLMYRTSMSPDHGMIFTFDEKSDHTFWMHNTCISLDMVFIDGDGLIVGIEENTPTLSDDTFAVGCPSTYVLELNAGWARAHAITAGTRVKIEGT